jgi:hypothetical protein
LPLPAATVVGLLRRDLAILCGSKTRRRNLAQAMFILHE